MSYIIKISSHNPNSEFVIDNRKYYRNKYNVVQSINVKKLPEEFKKLISSIPLDSDEKKLIRFFLYELNGIRKDCSHFMQILEHTHTKQMDFGEGKKDIRHHKKIFEIYF